MYLATIHFNIACKNESLENLSGSQDQMLGRQMTQETNIVGLMTLLASFLKFITIYNIYIYLSAETVVFGLVGCQ